MRPRLLPFAAVTLVVLAAPFAAGCGSRDGDPPATITPDALGTGSRIRQVTDPTLANHPANNTKVTITGASYLWTDTFDETANGKSKGTLYVQDVGDPKPYAGVSIFSPTFNPANLKPSPGDILDLVGTYQENDHIGTAIFPKPAVLPQISKPTMAPRFEYKVPDPMVIDPIALNDYTKGRPWISMLVTIPNVTFTDGISDDGNGRDTAHITADTSKNGVAVSNELFDLAAWNNANQQPIKAGAKLKSITGIVTWFYSFHVAPRTPADIVVQ